MKKISMLLTLFIIGVTGNAQVEKKEPPPPPPPKADITKYQAPASAGIKSQKDFLKRNPNVANLNWQNGKTKTIILSLKSREEERYDLTNEEEKKIFFGKYGVPPLQPPPPPSQTIKNLRKISRRFFINIFSSQLYCKTFTTATSPACVRIAEIKSFPVQAI